MDVREIVRSVASEHAEVPDDDQAALELDSLAVVTIVEALEDRLGIRVAPRDVTGDNFRSIASIVSYVESKKA
jgi:acyl carrier protein